MCPPSLSFEPEQSLSEKCDWSPAEDGNDGVIPPEGHPAGEVQPRSSVELSPKELVFRSWEALRENAADAPQMCLFSGAQLGLAVAWCMAPSSRLFSTTHSPPGRHSQVEIMMALEERFEITLDEEGAEKISTVQEAADLISAQMTAK